MSKVKLRIVPVITKYGVKYLVQRKGLFFWRTDANAWARDSFVIFLVWHFDSIKCAVSGIEKVYGKSYSIQDYQP